MTILRRNLLFRLWVLISIVWLLASALVIAQDWSGERFSMPAYSLYFSRPSSWEVQHPECRERYGVWQDGTRMDASEFLNEFGDPIISTRRSGTPEQIARDNYANIVRDKIASCEEAQWLPIAKEDAIKNDRIRLIVFASLPLVLFWISVGLTNNRAKGNVRIIAAKSIATIAAVIVAVETSVIIKHISDNFIDIVLGNIFENTPASAFWYRPNFLNGPRLDVICAMLIPISIALWRRRPSAASKRIVACCLGITAGFVPVVVQIISWPFIRHSPDGVWAVAAVAVFTAASLSFDVTRRVLKTDPHDTLAGRTVPPHIRRGLIRLYVIVFVPWVAWFGHTVYKANHSMTYDFSQLKEFGQYEGQLYDFYQMNDVDKKRNEFVRKQATSGLELLGGNWDARTHDEISERINASIDRSRDRLTTAIYALLAGAILPFLYPFFLWVVAGFRKSTPDTSDV